MFLGPGVPSGVADALAQQQFGDPVPGAHEVTTDVFAGSDQVPGCFLCRLRNHDLGDLVQFQQPGQVQGVVPVCFHPVPGRSLELGRGGDQTIDARCPQCPGERKACWAGLVNDLDRGRECLDPGQNLAMVRCHPGPGDLTGQPVDRARDDREGVDIQAHVSTLMHSWNLQTSNVALPQWTKSGDNPRHLEEKVPAPNHRTPEASPANAALLTEASPPGSGPERHQSTTATMNIASWRSRNRPGNNLALRRDHTERIRLSWPPSHIV